MAQLQMLYSDWLDKDLVGWIKVLLLPLLLAWLLGSGTNHSLLFIVKYWQHHIETRQIQYHSLFCLTLVELVHKGPAQADEHLVPSNHP